MNARFLPLTAALLAVNLSGCASLIYTGNQEVTAVPTNVAPQAVACTFKNGDGQWSGPAGVPVEISRDRNPLEVDCHSPQAQGVTKIEPKGQLGAYIFGNIFALGIAAPIGMIWDLASEATFYYPDSIQVQMQPKTVALAKPRTVPRTVAVK